MTCVDAAKQFATDEHGVSAIEYGLVAGLVAVALIVGVTALGDAVSEMYDYIVTSVDDAIPN